MAEKISFIHASDFRLGYPLTFFSEKNLKPVSYEITGENFYGKESEIEKWKINKRETVRGNLFPRIPDSVFSKILRAGQNAATRVFEAAISRHVDFVLLTGDIFSWDDAGPAEANFLLEQFCRLEKEGILVYWVLSEESSSSTFPFPIKNDSSVLGFNLPENVYLLSTENTFQTKFYPHGQKSQEDILFSERNGLTLFYFNEEMENVQYMDKFLPEERVIVICEKEVPVLLLEKYPSFYWVLLRHGGEENETRHTLLFPSKNGNTKSYSMMHFPGSPQFHSPAIFSELYFFEMKNQDEVAPESVFSNIQNVHEPEFQNISGIKPGKTSEAGCSLVEMDMEDESAPVLRFLPTEDVTWKLFSLNIPVSVQSLADVVMWMKAELAAWKKRASLRAGALIFWHLKSRETVHLDFLRKIYLENHFSLICGEEKITERILKELNMEFSDTSPFFWNVSVETQDFHLIPAQWRQKESALGDFLRLIQMHIQENVVSNEKKSEGISPAGFIPHTLELRSFLGKNQQEDELRILADITSSVMMDDLLCQAEVLGSQLLSQKQKSLREPVNLENRGREEVGTYLEKEEDSDLGEKKVPVKAEARIKEKMSENDGAKVEEVIQVKKSVNREGNGFRGGDNT
ncbi:MAG: hypothetical protein Q4C96_03120 [Planctomycetia bacterium]|nr:hypothetical protein [Planctomycetia bacterium]